MATQKKKKCKALKLISVVVVVFLVIAAANVFADFFGLKDGNDVKIVVNQGDTADMISEKLKKEGIVSSKLLFKAFSRVSGTGSDFKTGSFLINSGDSYAQICQKLITVPLPEGTIWVTIPEGFELRQIADKLESEGLINREKFYEEIENGKFEYSFIDELPKRENRLEGYLFPDTYLLSPTDGEHAIINAMLKRFVEVFNEKYQKRAKEMDMTTDEVITLASIIEREALGDSDRTLVSSVFHNRLKSNDMPYLQSCATVQYILKERKKVLSVSDTKINSPYNTYINKGLPLGPIASPGEKAISAALYPEKSDYLFFVLDSSGNHRFAKTHEEHLLNQKK